jgi:hypothetical protein
MFDIFTGVFGKEGAIWLEVAETLGRAKQRVSEIAAEKPGSYFVFDSSTGQALYQIHATSLVNQSHSEMLAARKEWECAAEESKQALALFRGLNRTPASPDGNLALKNASTRESSALQKYTAAAEAYLKASRTSR